MQTQRRGSRCSLSVAAARPGEMDRSGSGELFALQLLAGGMCAFALLVRAYRVVLKGLALVLRK